MNELAAKYVKTTSLQIAANYLRRYMPATYLMGFNDLHGLRASNLAPKHGTRSCRQCSPLRKKEFVG
jgi:hypothetical protein